MSIAINLPFRRTQIFALSLAFLLLATSCSSSESSSPNLPTSTTSTAEAAASAEETATPSPPSTTSPAAESQPDIATSIAAYDSHSCAISEDKKVFCWGSNWSGQLGVGQFSEDLEYSPIPLQVKEITDTTAITTGGDHTCALHQDGTVSCWGSNSDGQAGQLGADQYGSDIAIPEKVPGITDAVAVAAGRFHTCALHQTGTVSCWGGNWSGQLGKSPTLEGVDDPAELVQVSNINDATAIAIGGSHTCALHQGSTVSCWGNNRYGQLGNGQEDLDYSPTPVQVKNIDDATAIVASLELSCALRQDGTVLCWGHNEFEALGSGEFYGDVEVSTTPVTVIGITDAVALETSGQHSCALHKDGTISCWGRESYGALGADREEGEYSLSPRQVKNIDDATAIAAGDNYTCALRQGGAIFCWGRNRYGQLGTGQTYNEFEYSLMPVRVGDFSDSASPAISAAEPEPPSPPSTTSPAISAAESAPNLATSIAASYSHSCAVSEDKKVFCWGSNENGKLGIGKSKYDLEYSAVPLEVAGIADAAAVATGENHTCALHESGTVSCWGRNTSDQLGSLDSWRSTVPVQIDDIKDAVWIAAGEGHTCAVHLDGTISCWGYSRKGALGNRHAYEDENFSTPTPVRVEGITDATAVTASSAYTCALHRAGTISCWGNNSYGQLGSGETSEELEESAVPVQVAGITDAIAIASNQWHSCALRENGTIACWGDNDSGLLGSGHTREELEESAVPVQVAGITDATAIATGKSHSCALRENGTIACWGSDNGLGLFGEIESDFQETDQIGTFPVPVQVTDITDAVAIATGEEHSCALHQNGNISCWGYNLWGRLGNGQSGAEESDTPVEVAGISNAKDIAAVAWLDHTCVLLESGSISCWGYYKRFGIDQRSASIEIVEIDGISNAVDIAAGWVHSCALHETGTISCWGVNSSGALALEYFDPVEVEGITDAVAVATGLGHSCALHENGTISCWGDNYYGQLGNGTGGEIGDESWVPPVRVNGISDAIAIAAGSSHSCALHENGTISCWGNNRYGQLGNGTDDNSAVPVQVSFITDATAIALGNDFSCAVLENGAVACWGSNRHGQLGTWRHPDSESLPGVIPGVTDAVSITSGYYSSCALHEIGTIKCWGTYLYGEPVIHEVKAIAIGGLDEFAYYCSVRQNGKVYCWGNNYYGQLGNEAIWSAVPVNVVGFGG